MLVGCIDASKEKMNYDGTIEKVEKALAAAEKELLNHKKSLEEWK